MKRIRCLLARATRSPWQWVIVLAVGLVYLLPILSIPGISAVFVKLGDIQGESTDEKHKDWVDVQAVSWGVSRPVTPSAGGSTRDTGAPVPSEVQLVKVLDKASPQLMLSAAAGDPIPEVTLNFTKRGATGAEEVYYTITLSDVLVSSFATAASSSDTVPTESISLNFTKIQMSYRPTLKDGTPGPAVEARYDFEANKAQ